MLMKTKLFCASLAVVSLMMASCGEKINPNREKVEWISESDGHSVFASFVNHGVEKVYKPFEGTLTKASFSREVPSEEAVDSILYIPLTIYTDNHEEGFEVKLIEVEAIDRHFTKVVNESSHFFLHDECVYWDSITLVHIPEIKKSIELPHFANVDLRYLRRSDIQNLSSPIRVNVPACIESMNLEKVGTNVYWNVAEGNPRYSSESGCLYNKDKTELIRFSNNSYYTIPSTVQTIGAEAFLGTNLLRELCIPANVQTIGDNAFADVSNMESLKFSEGLKKIGIQAFRNMEYKTSTLAFPNGLEEIGFNALGFRNVYNGNMESIPSNVLQFILIPPTLNKLIDNAFQNTPPYVTAIFTGAAPAADDLAYHTKCRLRYPNKYSDSYLKIIKTADLYPKPAREKFAAYACSPYKIQGVPQRFFLISSNYEEFTIRDFVDENKSLIVTKEKAFSYQGSWHSFLDGQHVHSFYYLQDNGFIVVPEEEIY